MRDPREKMRFGLVSGPLQIICFVCILGLMYLLIFWSVGLIRVGRVS